MKDYIELKDWYLSNFKEFERNLNGESHAQIHKLRKEAISNFSELTFPTIKDEEWKYTNISPLLQYNFKPVNPGKDIPEVSKETVNKFKFDKSENNLLVFINGHYSEQLSNILQLPKDVIVGNIASAISENNPVVKKYFGRYADYNNHIFTALSTAFTRDGIFINVPDNKVIENPIHVLFLTISEDKKLLIQPRNLFVIGKNCQVTIIEHYASLEEDIFFTNTVTEVVVDENSFVDHVKLQEESKKSYHIARMEVDQEKNSNFVSHLISTGSSLSRNDFNARFNGEGGNSALNGLFMIKESQHFDIHSLIDHAVPHCDSHEHYKGILDDKSRGVFNGKIMVRKDAQKTNAFQENNNIILSEEALINTKPQLEIFADDVKCSHGATIGQLDDESLFYLRSRGINKDEARTILLRAFANDVVRSIKIDFVRNYLENLISERFGN
jgi:Fe-S cluster assembly protein SufD